MTQHEGWERVICDAEIELAKARERARELKASIRLFRQKQEAGEPLPEGLENFRLPDGPNSGSFAKTNRKVLATLPPFRKLPWPYSFPNVGGGDL